MSAVHKIFELWDKYEPGDSPYQRVVLDARTNTDTMEEDAARAGFDVKIRRAETPDDLRRFISMQNQPVHF